MSSNYDEQDYGNMDFVDAIFYIIFVMFLICMGCKMMGWL
jgi:hypothetical protein